MRIGIVAGLVLGVLLTGLVPTTPVASAAATPWINDLAYGSAGGGFYWDTASGMVWTAERDWHSFSPQPDRPRLPLWADYPSYGSAGQGFYWDPVSNQVWTSERDWHLFDPRPAPTTATVTGVITNDGVPVVGASVSLKGSNDPACIALKKLEARTPAQNEQLERCEKEVTAKTDASGRYRFSAVSPGYYSMSTTIELKSKPSVIGLFSMGWIDDWLVVVAESRSVPTKYSVVAVNSRLPDVIAGKVYEINLPYKQQ